MGLDVPTSVSVAKMKTCSRCRRFCFTELKEWRPMRIMPDGWVRLTKTSVRLLKKHCFPQSQMSTLIWKVCLSSCWSVVARISASCRCSTKVIPNVLEPPSQPWFMRERRPVPAFLSPGTICWICQTCWNRLPKQESTSTHMAKCCRLIVIPA